eukprot:EG_transcript_9925
MPYWDLQQALRQQPGDEALMSQLLTAVEEELRGVDTEEGQEGLAEPEEATFDLPADQPYTLVDAGHPQFVIAACPAMGRVVIARRALRCGTELIHERAALTCPRNAGAVHRLKAYLAATAGGDSGLAAQLFDFACPSEEAGKRWKALESDAEKALRSLAKAASEGGAAPLDRAAAARLLGVWQVNGLSSGTLDCLFPLTSRLEHSCAPNCTAYFVAPDVVSVRTSCPVQKGERLSINYRWQHTPTADRRAWLAEGYLFDCCCALCSGPDVARAFVCPACGEGPAYAAAGGSAAAQCLGVMAAAFGMGGSSAAQCMWCGTAVCTTSARPKRSRPCPITCSRCAQTFAAETAEVQALEGQEEEALASPAFHRAVPALLAVPALHWSHHLVVHAAAERLPHAEALEEVEALTGYILGTFDLAYGALHSGKTQYYEFLAQAYARAGAIEKARAAVRAAYIIRWLGCGRDAPETQRLREALENPSQLLAGAPADLPAARPDPG